MQKISAGKFHSEPPSRFTSTRSPRDTEQRYELAPSHSIASSACCRKGTVSKSRQMIAAGRSLMQSAELYSHPLRVLDVEARLGAPPVLQTAALQLLLQPILLRVPVRNGVGDVVHFGRAAASPVPGNQHVIAEHQAALLSVVFSDLHAQEIHIEVADLLIIVHLIRDVVDVEGLERLARGPGCRRYPGRRGCREAQALNELPPVHFSLFEILEQFCDDTFHCLSSYSEFHRGSIGLPALCHYTICEGSMGSLYLVGACTGRSAGFSPLRMRSTLVGCAHNAFRGEHRETSQPAISLSDCRWRSFHPSRTDRRVVANCENRQDCRSIPGWRHRRHPCSYSG